MAESSSSRPVCYDKQLMSEDILKSIKIATHIIGALNILHAHCQAMDRSVINLVKFCLLTYQEVFSIIVIITLFKCKCVLISTLGGGGNGLILSACACNVGTSIWQHNVM